MTQTETPTAEAGMTTLREALKEITEAADQMVNSLPGHWHDDATIRLTDAANDARESIKAAEQDDLYEPAALAASTAPRAPAAVPDELRRLSEAATPGEWLFERSPRGGAFCGLYSSDATGSVIARFNGFSHAPRPDVEQDANAALAAAAVNHVRTLADAPAAPPADGGMEGLREALREARSCLVSFTGGANGACGETIAKIDAALSPRTPAGAAGDLVGGGEPLAWAYEWQASINEGGDWHRSVGLEEPGRILGRLYRNIRPLYALGTTARHQAAAVDVPAERIARIIEPAAWSDKDQGHNDAHNRWLIRTSLTKADAILDTRPTDPGGARGETAAEELLRVIKFALAIDDHYEMRGFLNDWSFGDTSEWPEFAAGASRPSDDETPAASTASSDAGGAE